MLTPMADVRPFRALRYNPDLDLASVVCPPFDTISPQMQRELHERSPHNAVRIELAEDTGAGRYQNAARALHDFQAEGVLRRDTMPAFYLLQQTFPYGSTKYTRTLLFARLRVVPWTEGSVLPHEQTFPRHKADRLELYRAARINASPVFLFYQDADKLIRTVMTEEERQQIPVAEFDAPDGQHHRLVRIDEPAGVAELERAFADETLYIADGHHRYETALLYRDEIRGEREDWTGAEPENFALVGLVAADDPGLLVLPTHRVSSAPTPWADVKAQLDPLFNLEPVENSAAKIVQALAAKTDEPSFGLVTAEAGAFLVTIRDGDDVDQLLPQDRAPLWRSLDYAICDHAILRHAIGLSEEQTKDQSVLWFTEDAASALRDVESGKARYAVVLNSVPVQRVLELADAGERMPQKSTFFYPKVPTGLVFNLIED